jgi:hypothetical protein
MTTPNDSNADFGRSPIISRPKLIEFLKQSSRGTVSDAQIIKTADRLQAWMAFLRETSDLSTSNLLTGSIYFLDRASRSILPLRSADPLLEEIKKQRANLLGLLRQHDELVGGGTR